MPWESSIQEVDENAYLVSLVWSPTCQLPTADGWHSSVANERGEAFDESTAITKTTVHESTTNDA